MIGSPLHTETLLLHLVTSGPADADGVPTRTVQDVTLEGCNVQPQTTTERRTGGAVIATGKWRVSGPLEERIRPSSRVTWRGDPYDVDGEPAHYRSGTDLDHTEFVLVAHRG